MFFYFSGQHFFTKTDGSEILHVFGPEPNDHYKTIKHTLLIRFWLRIFAALRALELWLSLILIKIPRLKKSKTSFIYVLTMQVPFPPVITGPAHSCVWLLTSMLCFMLYISWQCRLFTTVNCTCLNLSCRGPFISHELKSLLKESSYFDTNSKNIFTKIFWINHPM